VISRDDPNLRATPPADVAPDLSFALAAFPGPGIIRLAAAPKGWALRAVRLRGTDVTDTGVDFRFNEPIDGLQVELTNRPTRVSGSVRGTRGESISDYAVLLFARDRARRIGDSLYFALARPDQSGRFVAEGLPPGEYLGAAVEHVDAADAQDPHRLELLETEAVPFTLGDAESRALDLTLITP
jgi:hypothetical protein